MVGGTINHALIRHNLWAALRTRLRGGPCRPLGPDSAVAKTGDAIRYPDALVSCAKFDGTARLVPGVVVVFEVLSPTFGRTDRIDKVREYHAIPTLRRYVILEHESAALTVLHREPQGDSWHAMALIAEDTLRMPEIGIEIPVSELYQDVDLPPIAIRRPDERSVIRVSQRQCRPGLETAAGRAKKFVPHTAKTRTHSNQNRRAGCPSATHQLHAEPSAFTH